MGAIVNSGNATATSHQPNSSTSSNSNSAATSMVAATTMAATMDGAEPHHTALKDQQGRTGLQAQALWSHRSSTRPLKSSTPL